MDPSFVITVAAAAAAVLVGVVLVLVAICVAFFKRLCCFKWLRSSVNPHSYDVETERLLPGSDRNDRSDYQATTPQPDRSWYHPGEISDEEAKRRLRSGAKGNDGAYLVYDNPQATGGGQYLLLVYYRGNIYRWKIQRIASEGKYILGEDGPGVARYKSVKKLITSHRGVTGRPIRLQGGGVVTLSKSYVCT